jgi:hypothetical protein
MINGDVEQKVLNRVDDGGNSDFECVKPVRNEVVFEGAQGSEIVGISGDKIGGE